MSNGKQAAYAVSWETKPSNRVAYRGGARRVMAEGVEHAKELALRRIADELGLPVESIQILDARPL